MRYVSSRKILASCFVIPGIALSRDPAHSFSFVLLAFGHSDYSDHAITYLATKIPIPVLYFSCKLPMLRLAFTVTGSLQGILRWHT